MPDALPHETPAAPPRPAGLTIRAREPGDWPGVAALMDLPKVRFGTLRLPFTSKDQWRKICLHGAKIQIAFLPRVIRRLPIRILRPVSRASRSVRPTRPRGGSMNRP